MAAADVSDAFEMLSAFLNQDEHYLASSKAYGDRGFQGLNDALDLFLEQSELGFVWMAYDENGVAESVWSATRSLPRWGSCR